MNLPVQLPEITIELTDQPEMCALTCLPVTADPLSAGIRLQMVEYTTKDMQSAGLRTATSSGPILCGGRELVEIRWIEKYNSRLVGEHVHWIDPCDPDQRIRMVMREMRSADGRGSIEDVDLEFPTTIRTGDTWASTDRYIRGDRMAIERSQHSVDGPFVVTIDHQSKVCLRVTSTPLVLPEAGISESFIDCGSGRLHCSRTLTAHASKETIEAEVGKLLRGKTFSNWLIRPGFTCLTWRLFFWK